MSTAKADDLAMLANHPVTILIVDDVSDTRRMYGSYFTHAGAGVLSARDGAEALDVIFRSRPDAVLLDLAMPRLTGWDVLKSIRNEQETSQLPVVAITGHVSPGIRDAALHAGADMFLTKPCLPHVALSFILQLVRARQA
jgi:two-component system, cell cycle response regulator DivK